MRVEKLKVKDITVNGRLREVDPQKVERLKESISRIGLINPITVSNGVLVAGLHRLTAFKELSIEEIDCNVIGEDELINREIEIDENLRRNELTVLERGRMEVVKKSIEEEWQKRQIVIPYDTFVGTTYEYIQIGGIDQEAKINLIGSIYENDKTFLMDLAELSRDKQVSVTSNLSTKSVEEYIKREKAREIRDKYPDKDKNQIKFQTDDSHREMAQRFIKMYTYRSIPDVARRLFETYLDRFFKEEKTGDDDEFIEIFEDMSGNISTEEYQATKKGSMI